MVTGRINKGKKWTNIVGTSQRQSCWFVKTTQLLIPSIRGTFSALQLWFVFRHEWFFQGWQTTFYGILCNCQVIPKSTDRWRTRKTSNGEKDSRLILWNILKWEISLGFLGCIHANKTPDMKLWSKVGSVIARVCDVWLALNRIWAS